MTSPGNKPKRSVLGVMASLELTVILLGLSIFLVFAGTLAQVDKGIWTVMDQYFRCFVAWIDFQAFANLLSRDLRIGGSFPFPGGRLLGVLLLTNLLVSHASRIKFQARGSRLLIGLTTLLVGLGITWSVITMAFNGDSSAGVLDPSKRVTLQLLYGGGAGAVLFIACWLLFKRKAGIVLLHAGVVILMLSELTTSLLAREAQMSVFEGQKVNFVEDTRSVELAFIDESDPKANDVYVIPEHLLRKSGVVKVDGLPISVETDGKEFMKNASLTPPKGAEANKATRGAGLRWLAVNHPEASGVDMSGGVDLPAVYVKLRDVSATSADLGTWLTGVRLTLESGAQTVQAGGKDYKMSLRFARTYKPYSVYLYNFRFDRYPGTDTPKDYSSFIKLEDAERGTVRDVRIWMNNPLRYRGDTLYQSSFDAATEKGTVLQVVENRGWMAPYVGCMIVAIGLFGQFQLHLMEFMRKRLSS